MIVEMFVMVLKWFILNTILVDRLKKYFEFGSNNELADRLFLF